MPEMNFDAIFECIPLLAKHATTDFEIIALRSLSNHNFRLKNAQYDYVLRIPRSDTSVAIDRVVEAFNHQQAIELGLAPKVLWRDNAGYALSEFLGGSRALNRADLQDEAILRQIFDRIALLQQSGRAFKGCVEIDKLLSNFGDMVPQQHAIGGYIHKALDICSGGAPMVPAHNDLVPENLLIDANGQLWMIDWEYSAMSSCYWDLATILNSARQHGTQCRALQNGNGELSVALDAQQLRQYQFQLQVLSVAWLVVYAPDHVDAEFDWLNQLDH